MPSLTYRMAIDDDLPGIERLWLEDTDWGPLSPDFRRHYSDDNPVGPARTVLALNTADDVVGQLAFLPIVVNVDRRPIRAFRAAASVVSKSLGLVAASAQEHPAHLMYMHGARELRADGAQLIYMRPDTRWARFLKVFPWFQSGSFPLWSRPLLEGRLCAGEAYRVERLTRYDDRVDRLWASAGACDGCSVVRDARYLRWKLDMDEYTVLGVEQGGTFVGLVAAQARDTHPQWTICELMATDDAALRAALAATCNAAAEAARMRRPSDRPLTKISMLVTPADEMLAGEFGFSRDDYEFMLTVHVLDGSIPRESVAPHLWKLTAHD